jgi:hypothetical protein
MIRRYHLDLLVWPLIATVALWIVASAAPGYHAIEIHVYVLVLGGMLMTGVVSAIGGAVPRSRDSELSRALSAKPAADGPVRELERMQRVVTLSVSSAQDLHLRLLPILRDIAAARLERTGKRPSEETLGRWWELLRPDRPAPAERFARGIPEPELRALVADLERM